MWITNLINESNETYETNKITLTAVKETITQWAAGQKVNAYILNVTAKNRILSILTRSGKGYEYKLTISQNQDGYYPILKKMNQSGYTYKSQEILHLSFKYYEDDPETFNGQQLEKIKIYY